MKPDSGFVVSAARPGDEELPRRDVSRADRAGGRSWRAAAKTVLLTSTGSWHFCCSTAPHISPCPSAKFLFWANLV